MKKRKPLQDLTLMDDYMFYAVMSDGELLRTLLEIILGISIRSLKYSERQKTEKQGYESKGIRLDVYVIDDKGVSYDIEVQVEDKGDLPKRARYYHSTIDIALLPPGKLYSDLCLSMIIFITAFDPFGRGRYIYVFQNRCDQERDLCLGDESKSIFINTKGKRGKISKALKKFIHYLDAGEASDDYTRSLDDAVKTVKDSEERRLEYMRMYTYEDELKAEAWNEGRNEGRIYGSIDTYREMGLSPDEIMEKIASRFSLKQKEAENYVKEALSPQQV